MNMREARREAYFHASLLIGSALGDGWEISAPEGSEPYTHADEARIYRAMHEIKDSLWHRSLIPPVSAPQAEGGGGS